MQLGERGQSWLSDQAVVSDESDCVDHCEQ